MHNEHPHSARGHEAFDGERRSGSKQAGRVLHYLFVVLVVVITAFPIYWIASSAIRSDLRNHALSAVALSKNIHNQSL